MKCFIEKTHGKEANRLLLVFISGIRALGLIDKLVTGPLWRKLQESSVSILEMSEVYTDLKEKCDSWSEDSRDVLDGSARLRHAVDVHIDEVWDALTTQAQSTEEEMLTHFLHSLGRLQGCLLIIYQVENTTKT